MEKMLDAGFCLPAIGFAFRRSPSGEAGGDTGF
jgi:hypothetical protein